MKADHGVLHRHDLLLQACTANLATKADWDVLRQAGLGSCLLDGLPEWTIKYAAGVVCLYCLSIEDKVFILCTILTF